MLSNGLLGNVGDDLSQRMDIIARGDPSVTWVAEYDAVKGRLTNTGEVLLYLLSHVRTLPPAAFPPELEALGSMDALQSRALDISALTKIGRQALRMQWLEDHTAKITQTTFQQYMDKLVCDGRAIIALLTISFETWDYNDLWKLLTLHEQKVSEGDHVTWAESERTAAAHPTLEQPDTVADVSPQDAMDSIRSATKTVELGSRKYHYDSRSSYEKTVHMISYTKKEILTDNWDYAERSPRKCAEYLSDRLSLRGIKCDVVVIALPDRDYLYRYAENIKERPEQLESIAQVMDNTPMYEIMYKILVWDIMINDKDVQIGDTKYINTYPEFDQWLKKPPVEFKIRPTIMITDYGCVPLEFDLSDALLDPMSLEERCVLELADARYRHPAKVLEWVRMAPPAPKRGKGRAHVPKSKGG